MSLASNVNQHPGADKDQGGKQYFLSGGFLLTGRSKISLIPAIVGLMILAGDISRAQEFLYPQGADITVNYAIYQNIYQDRYILTIERTIVNNDNFDLIGTYFSDNLPGDFQEKAYSARIDGDSIRIFCTGPIPDQSFPGYNTFRWVVDIPGEGQINNIIRPGQRLALRYEFDGPRGNYILPFHTACFFGGESGFFTTADTIFIPLEPQEVPTLDEWGIIILSFLILGGASVALIRRKSSTAPASV